MVVGAALAAEVLAAGAELAVAAEKACADAAAHENGADDSAGHICCMLGRILAPPGAGLGGTSESGWPGREPSPSFQSPCSFWSACSRASASRCSTRAEGDGS